MNKIPVFGTIVHAYGFAITQFFRLLGITWAPLAVAIALGLMLTPGFAGNHMPLNDSEEVTRQTARLLPFSFIITLIIRSMIAVGVTELALGLRKGPTFVYFSVGLSVWRFVGAWLLVILVMIIMIVGSALALGLLLAVGGTAFAHLGQGANALAAALAVAALLLAFYAFIFFVAVRLTFFIPPVIVAEKKIDLARGWQLTSGNFWRIFVIGVAIFIPLIAIGCAIFVAVYGTDLIHTMTDGFVLAMEGAKEAVIQQRIDTLTEAMRAKSLAIWPYTAAANLLVETFSFGLLYGASAFAYREVTSKP
ncbi:MAG TPA: glycerophosphoryl diester phosphodiesterase membrane domain-containing protein [Rhizomicrobium sp.]|jgi:hypothetical protein